MTLRSLAAALLGAALLAAGLAPAAWADCGPGPVVIKDQGAAQQSLAATTNATFLPTQTLAITLGTSGCSSSGLVWQQREQERFVAINADVLAVDMARGQGPYLEAFAALMGCAPEAQAAFAQVTRARYTRLLPAAEPAPRRLLAGVREAVQTHPLLSVACGPPT